MTAVDFWLEVVFSLIAPALVAFVVFLAVPSRSQMTTRALLLIGPALLVSIGVGLPWPGSDWCGLVGVRV